MDYLTLTDFYIFLIEAGFCFLFLILFCAIHYLVLHYKVINNALTNNKLVHFFYFFIYGALVSCLFFGMSYLCTKNMGKNIDIGLPAIILTLTFALSFYYSKIIQIGSLIPSTIWIVISYIGSSQSPNFAIILRMVVIAIYAIVAFCVQIYKSKKWIYFLLSSILIDGISTLLILYVDNEHIAYYSSAMFIATFLGLVFLAIIRVMDRWFTRLNNIANNSVYTNKYYLLSEFINDNFDYLVKTNNLSQALVILFEIKNLDLSIFSDQLIENIHYALDLKNTETLFFKTEFNKYGLILSGKDFYINDLNQSFKGNLYSNRLEKDNLYKLEQIIKSIPTKYEYDRITHQFELKAYISVFGVHSNDIYELLNDNMFMIASNDTNNKNIITIFNSNMNSYLNVDKVNYSALTKNLNINEIDISLEIIQFNESNKYYVFPQIYWFKKMIFGYSEILKQLPTKIGNTLLRNISIRAIEQYLKSKWINKYKLIIVYPIQELNDLFFSTNNFISKIQLLGLNFKNVVLCLNAENIQYIPAIVLKHLKELDEKGMKYILLNLNNSFVLKNKIKPIMVSFNEKIEKRLLSQIIAGAKSSKINVLVPQEKLGL